MIPPPLLKYRAIALVRSLIASESSVPTWFRSQPPHDSSDATRIALYFLGVSSSVLHSADVGRTILRGKSGLNAVSSAADTSSFGWSRIRTFLFEPSRT